MENLLTVEEAAKTLKVGEDTIRRWLRDGQLRGCKLGKSWRIPETTLAECVRQALQNAGSPTSHMA